MILNLYEKEWDLKKMIVISAGGIKSGKNYYLQLICEDTIAFGEASPAPEFINGKKLDYWSDDVRVKNDLIYLIENIDLQVITFDTIKKLHMDFKHLCAEAIAAFDMLLHDYLAKKQNIPVWKLYTSEKNKHTLLTKTSISDDLDDIINFIKDNREMYSLLKFKVTNKNKYVLPWDNLNEFVINLDFNGMYNSYSEFENDFLIKIPSGQRIIFEEPFNFDKLTPIDIIEFNKTLTNPSYSLIFDDSLTNIDRYDKIIHSNINCGFNLKIQKLGGIYPCYEMFLKHPNKQFMIGCMTETSLEICSGIQLGNILKCSKENTLLLDLDSDIFLGLDKNSPGINKFNREVKESIGLGYTPDISNLNKIYTNKRTE